MMCFSNAFFFFFFNDTATTEIYTLSLHDALPIFFEASYLNRTSDQQLAPTPFASAAPIDKDSIYNPYGATVFGYNRRLEEFGPRKFLRSEEHTSELQSLTNLVCRLLLEKKKYPRDHHSPQHSRIGREEHYASLLLPPT